jgi:hypothetical protein
MGSLMSLAVLAKKPFVLPSSLPPLERMVAGVDAFFEAAGIDTQGQASYIAAVVSDLWDLEWKQLCLQNGLRPDDQRLRSDVVLTYIKRGFAGPLRSEGT